MNKIIVSGKRKTAIAKATIWEGTGIVTFNKKPLNFLNNLQQLEISEPIVIVEDVLGKLNFNIDVNVKGGGIAGQANAARLAIARALVEYSKGDKLRNVLLQYDRQLLVADVRQAEPSKPNDSKPRAKRQKSYR